MSQKIMYRQGDVLLVKREGIHPFDPTDPYASPRDAQGRIVLAHGEVTGHAHAIATPGVVAWGMQNQVLSVPDGVTAKLEHEEHAAIEIGPGVYDVIRQREATDAHERWQTVVD